MIEDKANNVEEISKYIPVLCFDAPYNSEVKVAEKVEEVKEDKE